MAETVTWEPTMTIVRFETTARKIRNQNTETVLKFVLQFCRQLALIKSDMTFAVDWALKTNSLSCTCRQQRQGVNALCKVLGNYFTGLPKIKWNKRTHQHKEFVCTMPYTNSTRAFWLRRDLWTKWASLAWILVGLPFQPFLNQGTVPYSKAVCHTGFSRIFLWQGRQRIKFIVACSLGLL